MLVVDDFPDIAEALGELLSMSGCHVIVTRNGEQAIEAAKTFHPQMVIVALNMPGMDGFDTVAALKQEPEADQTAVYVAHTTNNHREVRAKVRQAGFQHLVLKALGGYERFEKILSTIQVPPQPSPFVCAITIVCPTPGCGAVLRARAGLHTAGDPRIYRDLQSEFVLCPKCHARFDWPIPDQPDAGVDSSGFPDRSTRRQ